MKKSSSLMTDRYDDVNMITIIKGQGSIVLTVYSFAASAMFFLVSSLL